MSTTIRANKACRRGWLVSRKTKIVSPVKCFTVNCTQVVFLYSCFMRLSCPANAELFKWTRQRAIWIAIKKCSLDTWITLLRARLYHLGSSWSKFLLYTTQISISGLKFMEQVFTVYYSNINLRLKVLPLIKTHEPHMQADTTTQKSHYPPGNHNASHLYKCPISRS